MASIHLQNQVVFKRELAAKSWSTYISYELDEATQEITVETISVFYDRECPKRNRYQSRGRARIPYEQAPPELFHQAETLLNLPDPSRETTTNCVTSSGRDTAVLIGEPSGRSR